MVGGKVANSPKHLIGVVLYIGIFLNRVLKVIIFVKVSMISQFLVVSTRLYMRVCPSVDRSVRQSVGPSETLSLGGQKQRRQTTYALDPAFLVDLWL